MCRRFSRDSTLSRISIGYVASVPAFFRLSRYLADRGVRRCISRRRARGHMSAHPRPPARAAAAPAARNTATAPYAEHTVARPASQQSHRPYVSFRTASSCFRTTAPSASRRCFVLTARAGRPVFAFAAVYVYIQYCHKGLSLETLIVKTKCGSPVFCGLCFVTAAHRWCVPCLVRRYR